MLNPKIIEVKHIYLDYSNILTEMSQFPFVIVNKMR